MLYQSVKFVGVRAGFAFCVVLAGLPFFLLSRLLGGPKGEFSNDQASASRYNDLKDY